MGPDRKKQIAAGALLATLVTAFILAVFTMLSQTDWQTIGLGDGSEERHGWRYEILTEAGARDYEPAFAPNGYELLLPEGTRAVRISRTMTEAVTYPQLTWTYLDAGVEVCLDG